MMQAAGFLYSSSFVNTKKNSIFFPSRSQRKTTTLHLHAGTVSVHPFNLSGFVSPSLFSPQTEQFVHTLKDELVKSALLALHTARPGYVSKSQKRSPTQGGQQQGHNHQSGSQNQSPAQGLPGHSPTTSINESAAVCNNVEGSQTTARGEGWPLKHQDSIPHHKEYDEEEWVSVDFTFN